MKSLMLSVFWEAGTQPNKFILFIIQDDFEFNQKHKTIVMLLLVHKFSYCNQIILKCILQKLTLVFT